MELEDKRRQERLNADRRRREEMEKKARDDDEKFKRKIERENDHAIQELE